jgi:peptide deformylase
MTLLKIARMGHPVLLRRAAEVTDPTAPEIRRLVEDMVETMVDEEGAGLAAPQVYVARRVIVFSAPREPEDEDAPAPQTDFAPLSALINPVIEPLTEEVTLGWEGCLSVPGLTGAVPRYTHIRYSGLDLRGQEVSREATGFHARVVQHEADHLDGILYPMRMRDLSLLSFSDELRHRLRAAPNAGEEAEEEAAE